MYPKQPPEPFSPPNINSFLNHKLWSINEALYVMAGWPKENLFLTFLSPLRKEIKQHRSSFYLPKFNTSFDPNVMSSKHAELFDGIKKAIEKREIWAIIEPLHEGIFYLVRPLEVILWAVINCYLLPRDLQIALNTNQINRVKFSDALQKKIRVKVTGQYLLSVYPEINVSHLCKHPLFTKMTHKSYENKKIPTSIRETINELFETKGKQGRESEASKDKQKRIYIPKPIFEVVEIASDGRRGYNFPLLKIALETFVQVLKSDRFALLLEMTQDEFINEFMDHEVMQLYLYNAPPLVIELARLIIDSALSSIQMGLYYNQISRNVVNSVF